MGLTPDFEGLLRHEAVVRRIEESIALREGHIDPEALWSFLLFSGYLKPLEVRQEGMTTRGRLAIPNQEVAQVYRDVFLRWLTDRAGEHTRLEALRQALFSGDVLAVELLLGQILVQHVSSFDTAGRQPEKLYQGLILGLLVWLEREYEVLSNHEAGLGLADVLIRPRQPGRPGVVLDLKVKRRDETPARAMKQALAQLETRRYEASLQAAEAEPVHALAVVFDGKRVWVGSGEGKDRSASAGSSRGRH